MENIPLCAFYFKIGACRRGNRCTRPHDKPSISRTLLFPNMYRRPDPINPGRDIHGNPIDPQQHFDDFYDDLFEELNRYGEVVSLKICENLAEHLAGNVYVQFGEDVQARNALRNLQGTFYAGRRIVADFSPVTNLTEASCLLYEDNICFRGKDCSFMHVKMTSREKEEHGMQMRAVNSNMLGNRCRGGAMDKDNDCQEQSSRQEGS